MEENKELIEDFSSQVVRSKTTRTFSLTYKGIEVSGTVDEYNNDLWNEWDQEVIIDSNDDLSDDDLEFIEEYILEKLNK